MNNDKNIWWYVYVLRSKKNGNIYIGSTNDLRKRLNEHNLGMSKSTKPYAPWTVESFVAVLDKSKARELERYFKTGSGAAVLKKRILNK